MSIPLKALAKRGKLFALRRRSEFSPLAIGLVEENRSRARDVERIDRGRHWDRRCLVADRQDLGADPVPFAAKDDAAVARKIGFRRRKLVRVRMGGDTAHARSLKFFER